MSYPSITFNMLPLTASVGGASLGVAHRLYICETKERGKKSCAEADRNGPSQSPRPIPVCVGLRYVHTLLFLVTTVRQLFLFPS